ncbi:lysylphosphatidylglycerol synthase transmembrane domain-containing protein [Nitratifractor sp.]
MGNKRLWKFALKLGLSLLALGYVLHRIDLEELGRILARTSPLWLLLALLFFNLSKIVSSLRLNRFFQSLGLELEELEALRLYYIGMFYNLFLPGGIGGDGYKIYLLQKHREGEWKGLLAATLLDRLSGLAPLLFFAGLLFLLSDYAERFAWLRPLDWLGLGLVFPVLWGIYRFLFPRFRSVFLSTTLLGALTQLLQLASAWAIARAIGLEGVMTEVLTLFLLSSVAAVLPISVGGVGVREFVFLYGFTLLGLPPDPGVAFSLLFFLITALSSLKGLFLRHGLERSP